MAGQRRIEEPPPPHFPFTPRGSTVAGRHRYAPVRPSGSVSAGRTSDRLEVRWPHGLQMKFYVYERVRDPLHGVGGVHEGFAQVLDLCFSLRVHVLSSVALLAACLPRATARR